MRMVSLDEVVRSMAAQMDDPEADRTYTKLFRLASEVIEDLGTLIIPDVKSCKVAVEANLTAPMPKDCVKPIQAAKLIRAGGADCVYPLGQKSGIAFRPDIFIPSTRFGCPETSDETPSDVCYCFENFYNLGSPEFFYMPWYYGEFYGYSEDRFFGYWDYDQNENQLVFDVGQCIRAGDEVLVKYKSDQSQCKLFPVSQRDLVRYKTLWMFWETSSLQKGRYFLDMFQRAYDVYKRSIETYSYDDYINAITRGYKSAPQ